MPNRSAPPRSQAASGSRWLAAAGMVSLTAFAGITLVHGLLRADHALLTDGISALGAGGSGWIQALTFIVSGLLMLAFAIGLYLHLRPSRAAALAAALIGVFGIGIIGLAVFPATDADGRYVTDRALHNLSALVAFTGAALAPFPLARRFADDPRWRPFTAWMLLAGAALVALHLGSLTLVVPPDGPLHEWLGLSQWLFVAVWYPTIVAVAWRLATPSAASP